jgi:hypothetical protein
VTICASVKVRDGLVLGTDSKTQILGRNQDGHRIPVKSYCNARKLFKIGQLPIGVMTYGIGNLGPQSLQGLVRKFNLDYSGEANIEIVSKHLFDFFNRVYWAELGETPGAPLGFFVAGYTDKQSFPEEWEFLLPRDHEARRVRPVDQFGASWRGIEIPFTRLYKGYDPRAVETLREAGVTDKVIDKALKAYESPVIYDGMPVQDAINFAIFILQTTIGLSTFELGDPSCGGPLQVATILPEAGFEWIQEPTLSIQSGC